LVEPPPPVVYEPPPPPRAAPDLTVQRHDGFYLRIGIGPAWGKVTSELDGFGEVRYTGFGPGYEFLLGGTIGGLVIGGGFVGQNLSSPDFESDGGSVNDVDGTIDLNILGPFIDYFPDERGGAHFGLMLGFAGIGYSSNENADLDDDDFLDDDRSVSSGWGASLWAGYGFWVGSQWSIGPELRGVWLSSKRDVAGLDADIDDTGYGVELLFSALHH
jgi:outer membrane autotransporter protein